jgi:hypothetical protein
VSKLAFRRQHLSRVTIDRCQACRDRESTAALASTDMLSRHGPKRSASLFYRAVVQSKAQIARASHCIPATHALQVEMLHSKITNAKAYVYKVQSSHAIEEQVMHRTESPRYTKKAVEVQRFGAGGMRFFVTGGTVLL